MMPPLTRLAKINPTIAASNVTIAEIRTARVCSDLIFAMAPSLTFNILSANGVDFFVEFVAERVDSRKAASHCCEIPRIKLLKAALPSPALD